MSTPPADEPGAADALPPASPVDDATPEPAGRGDGWVFVSLIADNGVEPPASLSDPEALGAWCAVTAPWHPALLKLSRELPRLESVDSPEPPASRHVVVIAGGQADRFPSGYRTQAEDAGAAVVEAGSDRVALVNDLLRRVAPDAVAASDGNAEITALAKDFLALGTACWFVRDLTTAMSHPDCLDRDSLTREVLAGADAWGEGDANTARNRLRAAFEMLTQARERYYPVDAYLIDLCLVDPAMPAGSLTDPLDAGTPVTFIAPAQAIEAQAARDPEAMARVREAIAEGRADVVGGSYAEVDEPILPLGSILWQFRQGARVYREHLDGRNVETVARRRFGLYPMLPQVAKRFAFRFAVHLGFDAGRFPIRTEAKRLWESPDHTSLESLTRPPLAADRPSQGVHLPWRLGKSMRDDHVATLPLIHWPGPLAGWFVDLRRVTAYSPVFARWVTLNDYFHLTDRPYETFSPEPDDYVTPYLAQAVARKDARPISRRASHARLRARFDALQTARATAEALGSAPETPDGPGLDEIESALENGRLDEAEAELDVREPLWAGAVVQGIAGKATSGRPGYLVVNPAGVARRAAVLLPDAAPDLRPDGPLRAAQFTEEGVQAVVELPAFGYAWVPRETNFEASPAPAGGVTVRDRVLRNETVAVEIDPETGGLRGVKGASEDTARVGQQLVVNGLVGVDGKPAAARMKADRYDVDYGGPALAQVVTAGSVLGPDGRPLAAFRQRVRLWTGRPVAELEVTLDDVDPAWLASVADADPWAHNLACRWAWPDPSSMLRRTSLLSPSITEAERPETPDAIDVSTRRQRTALLFQGHAHHRRHGPRMLDSLLLAGRETGRKFRLGVALDLESPFHASAELMAPAYVVATESGPPPTGPTGWLFQVDNKSVAVTAVDYVDGGDETRGWGLAFTMLETAGRSSRCRLRIFRNPSWARQTDFHGDAIVDLPVDADSVSIDFTPHELARVEVTLG